MVAGGDEDQLSGVLDLVERLRERPALRRRERLRPLLFLLGSLASTRRVADAIGRRCAERRAPVSRIAARTERGDIAGVLREAMWELSRPRCHPRFEPEPRFQLLEMLLRLRELRRINLARHHRTTEPPRDRREKDTAADPRNRRLVETLEGGGPEAKKAIRQLGRRQGRSRRDDHGDGSRFTTFLTYLDHIAPIAAAVVVLISVTAATTVDLVVLLGEAGVGFVAIAGRILAKASGWFEGHRYRWFVNQPYTPELVSTDFHDFVLDIIRSVEGEAERRRRDEQLDLLLVGAFLEDLRRNYRRRRRAAWARVSYPVLIFDHLTTGHIGCRFIEIVERVRAMSQVERGQPDFDPLVIVAGIDPETPAEPGDPADPTAPRLLDRLIHSIAADKAADDTPADLEDAAVLWQRHRREQERVDAFGPLRVLLVDLTGHQDPDFDAVRDRLRPARNRPWLAHPLLPWLAMFALFTPSATWYVHKYFEGCKPPAIWQADNKECVGLTDGSYSFSPRLSRIEERIKKANDAVVHSGKPYVTIVYLGPLTSDPTTKNPQQDLLSSAQGELVGLSIAQQSHNDTGSPLRVRILLANAGSKMRYAEPVAEQIRNREMHDRHIVGVAGFEQSRQQTQDAIAEISRTALPMIGTANSYDGTARQGNGFSHYYFRLAPPNNRLAEHDAHWALSGTTDIRVRSVTVFFDGDPADLYSRNLADDFARQFTRQGGGKVTLRSYNDPSEVPNMVKEACIEPSDLFFYAGRSDEFRAFLTQLDTTVCGKGRRTILADDEIAKYVNDNAPEIGGDNKIRLFYTPLALEQAWRPPWIGNEPVPSFFGAYKALVGEIAGKEPDMQPSATRAAVSYDATLMFTNAAAQIYADQQRKHSQPTPAAVLAELIEPAPGTTQGASGVLTFGPRGRGHQVENKPVMLATVQRNGQIAVRAVCGQLVPGNHRQVNCPSDDRPPA